MSGVEDWDAITRRLILAEIRLGLTFARLAETHYAYNKGAAGHHAYARALEAFTNAERRLDAAEAQGRVFGDLRAKLRILRQTLARCDQDEVAA